MRREGLKEFVGLLVGFVGCVTKPGEVKESLRV